MLGNYEDSLLMLWHDKISKATSKAFPFYDIYKKDSEYTLEIALAGYGKKEISVEVEHGMLIITGNKFTPDEDKDYVCKGITSANFEKAFALDSSIEVDSAEFKAGLLTIGFRQKPVEKTSTTVEVK